MNRLAQLMCVFIFRYVFSFIKKWQRVGQMATLKEMATVSKIKTSIVKSERKRSSSWLHTGHCQSFHKSRNMPLGFQLSVTSLCIPLLFIIHYSSIHYSWLDTSWSQVCVFQPQQQELGGKRLCRDLEWWRKGGEGDFSEWWWGLPPFQDYKTFWLSSIPTVLKVSLAIRQCFECIHGYIQLGLVLIRDIFIRNSLLCSIHTILFVKPIAL